jgi:hypothetical protein
MEYYKKGTLANVMEIVKKSGKPIDETVLLFLNYFCFFLMFILDLLLFLDARPNSGGGSEWPFCATQQKNRPSGCETRERVCLWREYFQSWRFLYRSATVWHL